MPTPAERDPIRPARGLKLNLDVALVEGDLEEGELVYAQDLREAFVVYDDAGNMILQPITGLSLADQAKLDGIDDGANAYVLPAATLSALGGIKPDGTTCTIDPDGTLHTLGSSSTPGAVSLVSGSPPLSVTDGDTTPVITIANATTSAVGVVQLADAAAITAGTAGRVVDAAQLKASGPVPAARTITAGTGLSGGGDLSSDRSLAVVFSSQAQAEAGTDTTTVMNPLRVAQATADLAPAARTITAGTGLLGGGDLSANRSLEVDFASQVEAEGGADALHVMSSLRVKQQIDTRISDSLADTSTTQALSAAQGKVLQDSKVPSSRTVTAGTGLAGGGDLTINRTLSVDFADQAEAEAGTATDKVMSPLRVAQATADLVPQARLVSTGTGLTGGGSLAVDRTLALDGQALAIHNLSSAGLVARTAPGVFVGRTIVGSGGITVTYGNGVSANPLISPAVASQAEAEAGTAADKLMTPQRVAQAIAALGGGFTITLEVFTASGTFTKLPNDVGYWVVVIGGGGSGARSATGDPAGGGGGGGRIERFLSAAEVTATVAVTVGAGGAAITNLGGDNGQEGGSSGFGGYLSVFGGQGGIATGSGGNGGGMLNPSLVTLGGTDQGGMVGGGSGFSSVYGGGGGNGGASVFGGGGGGRSTGLGGGSIHSGAGGAGGTSSSGQDGQTPGGGGGATQTGVSSGAGARGEVRIYRLQSSG